MIEPSDQERVQWPETTRLYVEALEEVYDQAKGLQEEFESQIQHHYGMHAGFCDAKDRLGRIFS